MGGGATAREVGSLRKAAAGSSSSPPVYSRPALPAAPAPLVVRASFDTPTVQFGAAIRIHVVVLLDATQRAARFAPHRRRPRAADAALARTNDTHDRGDTITVTLERTYSCLSSSCVSPSGDATPACRRSG